MSDDADLARRLGEAILGGPAPLRAGPSGLDTDQHLELVRRAAAADRVTRDLLAEAVGSARSHGISWAALGAELSLSRQAVQQRFGSPAPAPGGDDPDGDAEERWLGPVTAFDEMAELDLAGRLGWRTVQAGLLRHRMVRTATRWEHRRCLAGRAVRRLEADGWEVGCRAFPWVYMVRALGPVPEGPAGSAA